MSGKGHNSFAKGKLRTFFNRIEQIEEELKDLNASKADVYSEARGEGFDVKVMRVVLQRRRQDRAEVQERDALIDLYESALLGTENATRARAREAEVDGNGSDEDGRDDGGDE
jgi:uncharacterized protein (UPF0335 family)